MSKNFPKRFREGMNYRDAIRTAQKLGFVFENVRKTGELRVSHPTTSETCVAAVLKRAKNSLPGQIAKFFNKIVENKLVVHVAQPAVTTNGRGLPAVEADVRLEA